MTPIEVVAVPRPENLQKRKKATEVDLKVHRPTRKEFLFGKLTWNHRPNRSNQSHLIWVKAFKIISPGDGMKMKVIITEMRKGRTKTDQIITLTDMISILIGIMVGGVTTITIGRIIIRVTTVDGSRKVTSRQEGGRMEEVTGVATVKIQIAMEMALGIPATIKIVITKVPGITREIKLNW